MKVLVACEESQRVCIAFRNKGHEAYSCDIQECSGGHPEWHIQDDVLKHLDKDWDMILAFPPCTHLAVSGARHFEKKRNDGSQREAIEFFCKFLDTDCEKVAIENPVNIISGEYIKKWFPDLAKKYSLPLKPTQTIQPYFFGEKAQKKTCLWLKGLPQLISTNIVEPKISIHNRADGTVSKYPSHMCWASAKERSKTFKGIAEAMAEQWGKTITKPTEQLKLWG